MSNLRTIFWLSLLTLATVAANVLVSYRMPVARALPNLTLLDPSLTVESVTISRPGEAQTVLKKEDRWTLVRPFAGPADGQVILRMLDALTSTPVGDTLSKAERQKLGRSLDDFGLEAPSLRVNVSDGARSVELSFGAYTPSSNGVYAVAAGSESVMVVPRAVRVASDLSAEALRERNIFPYDPEFVRGFDLRTAGESPMTFVRTGDGWKVEETAASAAKVRNLLERMSNASALDFCWPRGKTNEVTTASDALLVGYGLDSGAAVTVTLRCGDGVDRRIAFGNSLDANRVYALVHNGGAVVTVDAALKAAVLEGTRSFEDVRLFPVEAGSVSSFTIVDGDTSYVLARVSEEAWRLDAPVSAPADAALASAMLGRVLALTPADVVGKGLSVSISTNGTPFVVAPAAVLGDRRLEDLRSREILRIDAALVRRLVSTAGGRNPVPAVSVAYSREHRSWNAETEADARTVTDDRAIAAAIAALAPLKAERIVTLRATAADLSRYGLEHPHHTLAIDQEKDGAVRRNIFIGNVTKGGRFATVGSAEAIFVLSAKTVSALTAPLLKD